MKTESHWLSNPTETRNAGDRVIKDVVVPMEVKADFAKRELVAYASVFDVLDRQGDIVVQGAFAKSLQEDAGRIKVLYQHDTHRLIGKPIHMEEDSKGLLTVSRISKVPDGDLALTLAADGVLDRMSIGFEVRRSTEFEDEALRASLTGFASLMPMHYLEELKLWEYSPVTFPANVEANVIAVRSAGGGWVPLYKDRKWPAKDEPEQTDEEIVVEVATEPTEEAQVEVEKDDEEHDVKHVCAECGDEVEKVLCVSCQTKSEEVAVDLDEEIELIKRLREFAS